MLSSLFVDFHGASCWSAACELVSVGQFYGKVVDIFTLDMTTSKEIFLARHSELSEHY